MAEPMNPNRVIWIESQPRQPLCDVPWLGTSVVLSDGSVNFCCFSNAVVGNVKEQSFEQIWNGAIMRSIRQALSERRLPRECQSVSCPIYRGDELNYIIERMEGPNSFKATGTHNPHAKIREWLSGSKLEVNPNELRTGDKLKVNLKFHYQGEPMVADLFVGVCYPDGVIHFLPDFEEYAVPFKYGVEFSENRVPLRLKVFEQGIDSFPAVGEYHICAALFEHESNPNLLSNCYWSDNKMVHVNAQ
jgi:hypothetical protein